ncbi:hypothetical protein [Amycolatopsis silviterrae]|uniref:Uncharacterized protein n=1 Tax=Amycolatopsis silviterrae TaxID=1656914 RepID=A0ABW5H3V6_9PSEU
MTRSLRERRSGVEAAPCGGNPLPLYPANGRNRFNPPDRHRGLGGRHDDAIEEDR